MHPSNSSSNQTYYNAASSIRPQKVLCSNEPILWCECQKSCALIEVWHVWHAIIWQGHPIHSARDLLTTKAGIFFCISAIRFGYEEAAYDLNQSFFVSAKATKRITKGCCVAFCSTK
jgi:hypothetical protein